MAVTTAGSSVTSEAVAPEPRPRSSPWVIQVTALSLLLGCLLGVALQAQRALREAGLPGTRYATLVPYYQALKDANQKLQQQVEALREKTLTYQTQMAAGVGQARTLQKDMLTLQMQAGLMPVHGPGLVITLHDFTGMIPDEMRDKLGPDWQQLGLIHDQDLAAILNELKAAGAEALAIAGVDGHPQRVILNSAPRCAGPIIRVNEASLSGPFTIWAIGEPKSLESALKLQGGIVQSLQLDRLGMIQIKQQPDIKLPGYSGSFNFRYAKPVGTSKPIGAL
jgi:uncharacterized protein YlxW (UPF0749 family)